MALTHQLLDFEPRSKIPFLGSLELPKGHKGGLHRYMGKVKKFGASSTLIFWRNSYQKKVRAQCAPRTIRVNGEGGQIHSALFPDMDFLLEKIGLEKTNFVTFSSSLKFTLIL